MALITRVPEPNIWDAICKEFDAKRPPFIENTPEVKLVNYDASLVSPVFYGKMHHKLHNVDTSFSEFDPAIAHPACLGHTFVDAAPPSPPKTPPPAPDKKTCPPHEYLEYYVFPHLLPSMEAMLTSAKKERCFERKRTKFNALDFLTESLYKNNPNKSSEDRADLTLFDIPFVQEHLKKHPRPPLPLSLIWTEEEAVRVIQSHWRGFLIRRNAEVQELRQWQREWRAENENIRNKVENFWADKYEAIDAAEHEHKKD